jgi:hypothetical protein
MDETFTLRELLNFLRSKRVKAPDVQEPSRRRQPTRIKRGVVPQVVNLYHTQRDAEVISMLNEIVTLSVKARDDGHVTSADRYAVLLADKALMPLLGRKGFVGPKGYRFQDYPTDWANLRAKLAQSGYSNMRIYDAIGRRIMERVTEKTNGIIRDVQKELTGRAA